jgi:hypothetical protein
MTASAEDSGGVEEGGGEELVQLVVQLAGLVEDLVEAKLRLETVREKPWLPPVSR